MNHYNCYEQKWNGASPFILIRKTFAKSATEALQYAKEKLKIRHPAVHLLDEHGRERLPF